MNWTVLKALNKLYNNIPVKTNDTILENKTIENYLYATHELEINRGYLKINPYYQQEFKDDYELRFLNNFIKYKNLLVEIGLNKPQTKLKEEEIKALLSLKTDMDNGSLDDTRKQLIEQEASVRFVSQMFFKNDKVLDDRESLIEAVKNILKLDKLANDKDGQAIIKIECFPEIPKCIVLCENYDYLRRAERPRRYKIELWFTGGRNINALDFVDTRGLPIFYSCDWDYDGLDIYQSVRKKINQIRLLSPNGLPKKLDETEHLSLWRDIKNPNVLSGLESDIFKENEIEIIKSLIKNEEWIIEESNDLIAMVKQFQEL